MNNKCPKCGHDLVSRIKGSTLVVRCSNCDYSIVTSVTDPINEDTIYYSIQLEADNLIDLNSIKCISNVTGLNYLKAKDCLRKAPVTIYKGLASDVLTKKKMLDESKIKYTISPDFPY